MEQLSDMISRVLHGDDTIDFSKCSEGELAILYSEIHKMTIRLREQSENLERDKEELSDAIADISHQLKTPLTSMTVITDLLKDETDPEKQQELADVVITEPLPTKFNKFKKSNIEAFYYWNEIQKLM